MPTIDPRILAMLQSGQQDIGLHYARLQDQANTIKPVVVPQKDANRIDARPQYSYNNTSGEDIDVSSAGNGGFNASNAANIASSMVSGTASIINSAMENAQIADVSRQWGAINDAKNIGSDQYSSYEDALQDYERLYDVQPDLSWNAIRGGSWGQRFGNVFSAAAAGAQAGASTMNPYVVAGMAAAGAGAAIGGWLYGDAEAEDMQGRLRLNSMIARNVATQNINARNEEFSDYSFRSDIPTRSKFGGKIERKQQSLTDFANSVTSRQKRNSVSHSANFVREKVDGGVKIRIKR